MESGRSIRQGHPFQKVPSENSPQRLQVTAARTSQGWGALCLSASATDHLPLECLPLGSQQLGESDRAAGHP